MTKTPIFTAQHIYGYQPQADETDVFLNRIYHSVRKELMASVVWLKNLAL